MISPTTGLIIQEPLAPAERGVEFDQRKVITQRLQMGNPNMHTRYEDPKARPDDPARSPVFQAVEQRDYVCTVCEEICTGMEAFNEHCRVVKGRMMACEIELRKKLKAQATGLDASAIAVAAAQATAQALAPTLNALTQALTALAAHVTGAKAEKPKKPREVKPRGRPPRIQGTVGKDRPAPMGRVGQPPLAMEDPPEEPSQAQPSA